MYIDDMEDIISSGKVLDKVVTHQKLTSEDLRIINNLRRLQWQFVKENSDEVDEVEEANVSLRIEVKL